jgi:hypothetical protein
VSAWCLPSLSGYKVSAWCLPSFCINTGTFGARSWYSPYHISSFFLVSRLTYCWARSRTWVPCSRVFQNPNRLPRELHPNSISRTCLRHRRSRRWKRAISDLIVVLNATTLSGYVSKVAQFNSSWICQTRDSDNINAGHETYSSTWHAYLSAYVLRRAKAMIRVSRIH